jgi:EAL domain-containing protein (putative c-di-GMP-specific phosphodiesterase class I)
MAPGGPSSGRMPGETDRMAKMHDKNVISGAKYREAMKKSAEFKKRISEANEFRLHQAVEDAGRYFSELKSSSPEIFDILKIQRKEISELLVKKKTGLSVVLD